MIARHLTTYSKPEVVICKGIFNTIGLDSPDTGSWMYALGGSGFQSAMKITELSRSDAIGLERKSAGICSKIKNTNLPDR